MLTPAETQCRGQAKCPKERLTVIGRRRAESEARVQECTFVTDRRVIVTARSSLANIRISYVTLRRQHGPVHSARLH
jgi:hypothetical protein